MLCHQAHDGCLKGGEICVHDAHRVAARSGAVVWWIRGGLGSHFVAIATRRGSFRDRAARAAESARQAVLIFYSLGKECASVGDLQISDPEPPGPLSLLRRSRRKLSAAVYAT